MHADSFTCLLVEKPSGQPATHTVTTRPLSALPPGEVRVQVAYSSLNYKDALSVTGHPGVTRKFPHIPGIDASGTVVESSAPEFLPGDSVVVTGFDMGQNTWGGFAEYIRVPADWVLPLPGGMTLKDAMVWGTAGLTAALAMDALLRRDITPDDGDVLVTGATGGVGNLAVALLAGLGFSVVASTGKPDQADYLKRCGAAKVIPREEACDTSDKPLLAARWQAGVDTVGDATLGTLIRSLKPQGVVAACGLVGGAGLPVSVYPFLLRGVDLVGIDSANCSLVRREIAWERLAAAWKPQQAWPHLRVTEITLAEVPKAVEQILRGGAIGRTIVRLRN